MGNVRAKTRLARPQDVPAICELIEGYAAQGLLLPRTPEDIRACLGRFLVLVETTLPPSGAPAERLLGCAALEPYGPLLTEIRSLAVSPEAQGRGLGGALVEAAMNTARRRGFERIFAVTHAPAFFERHGFFASHRQAIPQKLARDCKACAKSSNCNLQATLAILRPVRALSRSTSATGELLTPA